MRCGGLTREKPRFGQLESAGADGHRHIRFRCDLAQPFDHGVVAFLCGNDHDFHRRHVFKGMVGHNLESAPGDDCFGGFSDREQVKRRLHRLRKIDALEDSPRPGKIDHVQVFRNDDRHWNAPRGGRREPGSVRDQPLRLGSFGVRRRAEQMGAGQGDSGAGGRGEEFSSVHGVKSFGLTPDG